MAGALKSLKKKVVICAFKKMGAKHAKARFWSTIRLATNLQTSRFWQTKIRGSLFLWFFFCSM
jgi:hypothetical protein